MSELDTKSDKYIVKFVEEKEIARNALQMTTSTAALSSYSKARKLPDSGESSKKLVMRGRCQTCKKEISLFKQYKSGKLNREPFKVCSDCWKKANSGKQQQGKNKEETLSSVSFQLLNPPVMNKVKKYSPHARRVLPWILIHKTLCH